jgi:hypothetical protein
VAGENDLHYRFAEETNVQNLLDGIVVGKYDIKRELEKKMALMLPSNSCYGRLLK